MLVVGEGSSLVVVVGDCGDEAVEIEAVVPVSSGVRRGSFVISFIAAELACCGDPVSGDVSVIGFTAVSVVAAFVAVEAAGGTDDGAGIEVGVICGFSVAGNCGCDVGLSVFDCVVVSLVCVEGAVGGVLLPIVVSDSVTEVPAEGSVGTGAADGDVSGSGLGTVEASVLETASDVDVLVDAVGAGVGDDSVPSPCSTDWAVVGSEVALDVVTSVGVGVAVALGSDVVVLMFVLNSGPSEFPSASVVVDVVAFVSESSVGFAELSVPEIGDLVQSNS